MAGFSATGEHLDDPLSAYLTVSQLPVDGALGSQTETAKLPVNALPAELRAALLAVPRSRWNNLHSPDRPPR